MALSYPAIQDSPKRIRVLFAGQFIADTTKAKLVWEHQFYPTYFFPQSTIPSKYLQLATSTPNSPPHSETYDLIVGDRVSNAAVIKYDGKITGVGGEELDVAGMLKVIFDRADVWFEEDEEIFVHPKDPYKRVDVLQSSRHVRVEINGVQVAETSKPRFLYETLLPVRTYIPKTDCRLDLLVPSTTESQCPYKGTAKYYSVSIPPDNHLQKDVVWWYQTPLAAVAEIRGYVAFYDEFVDVWVDGVKQERPKPRDLMVRT